MQDSLSALAGAGSRHITEYDPAWPQRFARERVLLERVVAELLDLQD